VGTKPSSRAARLPTNDDGVVIGPSVVDGRKTCTKCSETKPIEQFYTYAGVVPGSRYLYPSCKACHRAGVAARPKDQAKKREYNFNYAEKNREAILAKKRSTYKADPVAHHEWRRKRWEHVKAVSRERARRIRVSVLSHYCGGDEPHCACCGEKHLEFLALDHVNNDGAEHRRSMKRKGTSSSLYDWVRANGYPPTFQVLCHNCNCAKGFYGSCPHEQERKRTAA
jgi:hypothetical protein